jgi:hypothetical protein
MVDEFCNKAIVGVDKVNVFPVKGRENQWIEHKLIEPISCIATIPGKRSPANFFIS